MGAMTVIKSFNVLGDSSARILVLGSMPGVRSLEKQQYYGHPRNAFWRIIAELFNANKPLDYEQGQRILQREGIAVWDVLRSCRRPGSLDAAIEKTSMEMNDFIAFFELFKHIRYVFFNGGTAERLYKQHVWQGLPAEYREFNYQKLPSTSPAYAAMSYESKLARWTILQLLCHSSREL